MAATFLGVHELNLLSDIDRITSDYELRFGSAPINLSHWNPSRQFRAAITQDLAFGSAHNPIDYIYQADLGSAQRVIESLGFCSDTTRGIITPSGTASTNMVVRWLRHVGVTRVAIVAPFYFTVFYSCRVSGLETRVVPLAFDHVSFSLPDQIADLESERDAVWLTHPIYCTTQRLSAGDIAAVKALIARNVVVILDESFAPHRTELGPMLVPDDRVVGIYTPHKSLLINAVKFSAIAVPAQHGEFFEQWTDIEFGGLSVSNTVAVKHFLGPNFAKLQLMVASRTAAAYAEVRALLQPGDAIAIDPPAKGVFITIYCAGLPDTLGTDMGFLRMLSESTGAVFIPGIRNHFPSQCGFTFRLNLGRVDATLLGALSRLFAMLRAKAK